MSETVAEIAHVLADPNASPLSAEQWAAMYSKLWAAHDEALARIEWLKMTLMLHADTRRPN